MLSKEQLSKFKELFETEKQKLIDSSLVQTGLIRVGEDKFSDELDLTSSELDREMRVRMLNRESLYLKKIDHSLDQIEEGTFGMCESCDEEIELKRLELRPTATECVACKEASEHRELGHLDGRKHKSFTKALRLVG